MCSWETERFSNPLQPWWRLWWHGRGWPPARPRAPPAGSLRSAARTGWSGVGPCLIQTALLRHPHGCQPACPRPRWWSQAPSAAPARTTLDCTGQQGPFRRIFFPMQRLARGGGTAFPTCRCLPRMLPSSREVSGKPWERAHSRSLRVGDGRAEEAIPLLCLFPVWGKHRGWGCWTV